MKLPRKLKKFVKKLFKKHSSHWAKRMSMKLLVNYKELLILDWAYFKMDNAGVNSKSITVDSLWEFNKGMPFLIEERFIIPNKQYQT